jgi:FMN reductase
MTNETFRVAVVTAGTSDPSSTRLLADRVAQRVEAIAARHGHAAITSVIELREIATDVTTALTSQLITPRLQQAIDALAAADGVIAATPVYKAAASALFTSFIHVFDNDLLIASRWCWRPPRGRPGTRWWRTRRCARCSPSCAP